MSNLVTLKSEFLTVDISTRGAEIQSIRTSDEKEYLWQGDPGFWNDRAPILFPICGGLVDGAYTLGGKKYELAKHGFASSKEFSVLKADGTSAELILGDSEDTYASYPFHFEFKVRFTLVGKTLKIDFTATNNSHSTMYYSCGAHEGFCLPSGIDGAKLIFEKCESLRDYRVEGRLLSTQYDKIGDDSDTLVLDRKYFEVDAIILREILSRSLILCDSCGERKVRIDFPDFDHLLIWQAYGAPFVCIEPWSGLPDIYGSTDRAIENKESITALAPGGTRTYTHCITVL